MLECVVNLSEGRRPDVIAALAAAAGADLLDVHSDRHHHRSVLTLVGRGARSAGSLALAVEALDLGGHDGAHPRIGVVDVVPFVPYGDGTTMADALAARDGFAAWAADELGVPCFLYGPERTLPEVRRHAFGALAPDHGPAAAAPDRRGDRGRRPRRCWSPTTSGSPRPDLDDGPPASPPRCAARRCGRSAWPWATACRCPAT